MNRRNFFNLGLGASLATLFPRQLFSYPSNKKSQLPIIKAPKLNIGDKIALVAPAWMITKEELEKSIKGIKEIGLEPVYSNQILGKNGYFSGTDKERADDFNKMSQNPDIKGIIFVRGGFGCSRILDLINYNSLIQNPKAIIGFSDATVILNTIFHQTGLITFHGPVASTIHHDYSKKQFLNVLMNPKENYVIQSSTEDLQKASEDQTFNRYTINPGIVKGQLIGGNLSLICSMLGTPNQIDFENKIVMIEDIGEEPYRIDRMLTQLLDCGELQKAAGIVFGICKKCDKSDKSIAPNSFSLSEVILDRIKKFNVPSVYGLSFGHNKNNFTFPIGLNAQLDANEMTIKLSEKAVI